MLHFLLYAIISHPLSSARATNWNLPITKKMTSCRDDLPLKAIPGSYGNFFTTINDRLGFYYNDSGQDGFFQAKVDKYNSTVFRSNMPPGPFMAKNPQVVVLLDAKSFPVLFDTSKVEKKDVLTGTYVPSTKLTGGFRTCAYLDPSEPNHAKLKQLFFDLLASRKDHVIPEFRSACSGLFDEMELEVAESKKSDFNVLNDKYSFDFVCKVFIGVAPSSTALGTSGPDKANKWLLFQLHPLMALGLPKFFEELFLHTFPLPPCLVKSDYNDLFKYFFSAGTGVYLHTAVELGLSPEEACHNILFMVIFNAFGGAKALFPGILQFLAKSGKPLHDRLVAEIGSAVAEENGEVTMSAIEKMELTKSVVYEALRMDPPVKFQYGKAKEDMEIESHDAKFKVKKGEMLFGYQPFATRDERVFENGKEFIGDRFVGEGGKELLKYVLWSNGPETESPTVGNKQCPGKDFVVLMGRLLVVEFFLRYDTFTADVGTVLLGAQVTFTSLTKATSS